MKYILIMLCSITVLSIACKKKKTDDTPAAYQYPEGTGPYAPYTLGSTFVFESQTTTPAATDSFTYTVTKDTTIDGAKYKKIESSKPNLATTYYCNYSNGLRTEITYNGNFGGVSVPTVKQVVLKDNVPVNTTWQETLNITIPAIPIPIPVTFNYSIPQKDFTKTVLAKDYANCIQSKQIGSLPATIPLPVGTPSSVTIDYYFAKDIGLIQRDLTNITIKLKRANVIK